MGLHTKRMSHTSGTLLLLLTAMIWGMAFVAQSVGMDYIGPFTFNAARSYIALIILIPLTVKSGYKSGRWLTLEDRGGKVLIVGGILSGIALTVASAFQQFGIMRTDSVGKAGFITALYILIVPILGLFTGKKAGIRIWISVAIAVAGLYLLCMSGGIVFTMADIYLLLCAVSYSFQIMILGYFSPMVDGVFLSTLQMLTCAVLSSFPALILEKPNLSSFTAAIIPVLYAGLLSSGVGYTLQIVAQRNTDPVIASLVMSLESAFSLLAGWILLNQRLSIRELSGCALMFVAIILAQLPAQRRKKLPKTALTE